MSVEYQIVLGTGTAGWKIAERSGQVARAFGLRPTEKRPLALPLTGAFRTNDLSGVKGAVAEAAAGISSFGFLIEGACVVRGTAGWRVAAGEGMSGWLSAVSAQVPVIMSDELIIPFAQGLSWRQAAAVRAGMQFGPGLFDRLVLRAAGGSGPFHHRGPLLLPVDGLRLAIVQNGAPVAAFDLPTQEWLEGREMSDRERWRRTLAAWRSSRMISREPDTGHQIFVTSDLHLGHRNIIKYCARPFPAWETAEMDEVLIEDWNRTVRPGDRVFFLGDLTRNLKEAENRAYLGRLNGVISCIRGNHDTDLKHAADSQELVHGGVRFLFIHDPARAPEDFNGWVVHGHTHNNDLCHYPFFDPAARRINVSVEVTGYRPVSLAMLARMAAQGGGERVLVGEYERP